MAQESMTAGVAADKGGAPRIGAGRDARLLWVDAAKGVGIIAVVIGHVWTHGRLHNAVYSFHMPLFFMLSGYTARTLPMRQLAPRMLRMLGLPFLSFTLLLLGADVLIEGLRHVRPVFPTIWHGIETVLLRSETLRGPFAILWFVPCLLVARLAWNVLVTACGSARDGRMLLAMAGVAVVALLADRLGNHSPLGLLPVPAALLLIWLGALWRDWRPGPALSIAVTAFAVTALLWLPPVNMRAGDLGWPVVSLAAAAAIVDRLAALLRQLPSSAMRALAWIGRRSLVIMFVHLAFIHYLAPYAPGLVLLGAALLGSLFMDWLARLTRPGRLLFLGESA